MADDQNRLDVAELMFLLICEGTHTTSIIPTTRLRMMWIARQSEENLVSGGMEKSTLETCPLSLSLGAGTGPPVRA